MVDRLSKFQLEEQETGGVEIVNEDISVCRKECEQSLLGKLWGVKEANYSGLRNTMSQLWCRKGSLKVVELDQNFYQFIFSHQEERDRTLLKRPWLFENQILVLQPWHKTLTKEDESFSRSTLWVQIRGVPHHWSSKEVGWKLGSLFPKCLNVILPENGSKLGRMLKLLVEVNLSKPLLRGTKLKLEQELLWVDFKYEMLPTFCFYCGIVGHQEKNCDKKVRDSIASCVKEGQYGDWLRVQLTIGGKWLEHMVLSPGIRLN